jgi:thymidylate kinase
MAKPKLIILEGADGLGKTTHAKMLAAHFDAKLISQPSDDTPIGFIRSEAKTNPEYTGLERQLLIGISHTYDAFSKFHGMRSIVMDRSYISGMIYGKLMGLKEANLELLTKIMSKVYHQNISDRYDTTVFFLTAKQRFNASDKDIFETRIKWDDLKREYTDFYCKSMANPQQPLFAHQELLIQHDMTGQDLDTAHKQLMGMVR